MGTAHAARAGRAAWAPGSLAERPDRLVRRGDDGAAGDQLRDGSDVAMDLSVTIHARHDRANRLEDSTRSSAWPEAFPEPEIKSLTRAKQLYGYNIHHIVHNSPRVP